MYMFLWSNLVYIFFIIYIQYYPKLSYIKYHKIICASHEQFTSLYISKNWNVAFNVVALLLSHISVTLSTYFQHFLSPFKLFFSLLVSHFTITYSLTFTYFYLFISPLLYTLTVQFLHPFIFLLFWLFFSPFFYYKNLFFLFYSIHIFLTQKGEYSLSHTQKFDSSFSWWIFNSLLHL